MIALQVSDAKRPALAEMLHSGRGYSTGAEEVTLGYKGARRSSREVHLARRQARAHLADRSEVVPGEGGECRGGANA